MTARKKTQLGIVDSGIQLTLDEAHLLKECEKVIERYERQLGSQLNFDYERGKALVTIRDRRLYRRTHKKFASYCKDRFKIKSSQAYRLIEFYKTCSVLKGAQFFPTNERAIRPIQGLPLDKRRLAWDLAVLSSPDGRFSTRSLEAVANRLLHDDPTRRRRQFGEPIDFEGLRHAPINELGVVFLFGIISRRLGFIVESVQSGFPDCLAKRLVDQKRGRWEQVEIEFEYESRTSLKHGHDPSRCGLLVCWLHNWPNCPIPVLELKAEVGRLFLGP